MTTLAPTTTIGPISSLPVQMLSLLRVPLPSLWLWLSRVRCHAVHLARMIFAAATPDRPTHAACLGGWDAWLREPPTLS